jgi:hypothetical protein
MFCIAGHLVVAAPVFLTVGSELLFLFNATTFEAKLIGFQILCFVRSDPVSIHSPYVLAVCRRYHLFTSILQSTVVLI